MSAAFAVDNKPSSTILLYYVDEHFNFYFATHEDTYKARGLRKNPYLSVSIWKHNEMLIQADGVVSVVNDTTQKLEIVDKLAAAAVNAPDFWPPLLRFGTQDYVVFTMKPTWLRKLDLVRDTISQQESPFTEIIV